MSQSSPIDVASSEHVCYVHCNFCNTILAVSVPGTSLFNVVTVRCGHCANLLSVNMGSLMQTLNPLHHQDPHHYHHQNDNLRTLDDINKNYESSSSKCNKSSMMAFPKHDEPPRLLPVRAAPEKRQRVPSAYNRFIKEEIQRIKASNPDISHREAFSSAAKNWAHFPHIHFGLSNLDSNKQAKVDEVFAGEGTQKTQQFY